MVTEKFFQEKVIKRSFQVPVVIDFWAEWCGPCRMLGPVLEKLEKEYKGAFDLVKINTDENQELAMVFRVSSIPDVRIIRNGKMVDHFLGALPEKEIRKILDKHVDKKHSGSEENLDESTWEGLAAKNPMKLLEKLKNTEPKNIPPEIDSILWNAYTNHVKKKGSYEEVKKIIEAIEEENRSFQNQRRVTLLFLENKKDKGLDDLRKLLEPNQKRNLLEKYFQAVENSSGEARNKAKDELLALFYFLPPGDSDVLEFQKKLSRILF